MNGRAYDYNLGRFLSVDPFIEFPENSQSLNPYSYILNNPLSSTDPSGYLSHCGKAITCGTADPHTGFKNVNRGALRNGTENILEAVSSPASSLGLSNIGSLNQRMNFETETADNESPWVIEITAGTEIDLKESAIEASQLLSDAVVDATPGGFLRGIRDSAITAISDIGDMTPSGMLIKAMTGESQIPKPEISADERLGKYVFNAVTTVTVVGRAGSKGTFKNPASSPVGRKEFPLQNLTGTPTRNADEFILGRRYTGHSLDQAQNRGLTPSVIEDAIVNGIRTPDPIPGRIRNYSPDNNVTVITEGRDVITVIPGKRQ